MSSEDDGAVKIAVRERPIIENYAGNRTSVVAYHSTNKNIIIVNERPYEFDNAFGPNVSQKRLYEELVKPLVQRALQGYFCTVLADGQTGTGKTFTMGLQDTCQDENSFGVIPRALRDIFILSDGSEGNLEIFVSFVEIYNEKVYDLLSDDTNEQVNIKGFRFAGGMKKPITNAEEGFAVLAQGNKLRHTRPTKMNPESSRSHAIFTIHVSRETETNHFTSLLHLVDLAGSEGVRRTGHQGVALTEGVHINQGLLAIGKVLQALALKWKVIPYRDSVLTSVLQDSLKSNSYLALLACISPFPEDLSETVATLRFATNARSLKHSPHINAILQEIKKNKAKTPQKNPPVPLRPLNGQVKTPGVLKRAFRNGKDGALSAIRKPFYNSTFSTPNKQKRIEIRPLNQTDFGLTPKETIRHISKPCLDRVPMRPVPFEVRESLNCNDSFTSRCSIMSMNVSTSTIVDTPISNAPLRIDAPSSDAPPSDLAASNVPSDALVPLTNSYSPLIRRCVQEVETRIENKIENKMETKMTEMFDYLKEISHQLQQTVYDAGINKTCRPPTRSQSRISTSSENSTVSKGHRTQISSEVIVDESVIELSTIENTIIVANAIESFTSPASLLQYNSTQFPINGIARTIPFNNDLAEDTVLFQSSRIDSTVTNVAVAPLPENQERRRSSRQLPLAKNLRRSMRIEQRKSIFTQMSSDEDTFANIPLHLSTNNAKKRKDAIRRSIEKRKSLVAISEVNVSKMPVVRKRNKNVISNKTIAAYFKTPDATKKKTMKPAKNAKQNHEKAILDLLNSGSIKELQILPQIGLKTAFQIVTQRTLNGKFKNYQQVSKLPVWRGNAWERFKIANNIS